MQVVVQVAVYSQPRQELAVLAAVEIVHLTVTVRMVLMVSAVEVAGPALQMMLLSTTVATAALA